MRGIIAHVNNYPRCCRYMHAATRHCYYQRATLQLLLRQLRFCAAELAGIRQKQLQIADIGVQYFNRCGHSDAALDTGFVVIAIELFCTLGVSSEHQV